MAEGKKSFMFYCDWQETFNALPNDKAGELVKHILAYVNDENPSTDDLLINAVFANIKATLKRDLKKWERKSNQNRDNANVRWSKRKNANASERIKPNANNADSVIVKDKVIVNVNDINSRMAVFKKNLLPFLDKYPDDMFEGFYHYWTEHNENGKKMRFEYAKNQPFNISRRLATWFKRQNDFEKEKSSGKKENAGEMLIKQIQNG